jgi:hypothetical protein
MAGGGLGSRAGGWRGGFLFGFAFQPNQIEHENDFNFPWREARAVELLPGEQMLVAENAGAETAARAAVAELTKHVPHRKAAGWQLGHLKRCTPGVAGGQDFQVFGERVTIVLLLGELKKGLGVLSKAVAQALIKSSRSLKRASTWRTIHWLFGLR